MMKCRKLVTLIPAVCAASWITQVSADVLPGLYAVDNIGRDLIRIDPESGRGTVIGATGLRSFIGIAHDPTTSLTYIAGSTGAGERNLYTVDLETGSLTQVGPIDLFVPLRALTLDGYGSLHAIQNTSQGGGNPGDTYLFDPNTGEVSTKSNTGFGSEIVYDGALDPTGNRVWFSSATSGNIYSMDTASGPATLEFNARVGSFGMEAIAFNPDGDLFGVLLESENDSLYSIDRDTGALTRIGSTGFDQIIAMTYVVPVPSTSLIGVIASVVMCGSRRRR